MVVVTQVVGLVPRLQWVGFVVLLLSGLQIYRNTDSGGEKLFSGKCEGPIPVGIGPFVLILMMA
jgi:hypothetical protein